MPSPPTPSGEGAEDDMGSRGASGGESGEGPANPPASDVASTILTGLHIAPPPVPFSAAAVAAAEEDDAAKLRGAPGARTGRVGAYSAASRGEAASTDHTDRAEGAGAVPDPTDGTPSAAESAARTAGNGARVEAPAALASYFADASARHPRVDSDPPYGNDQRDIMIDAECFSRPTDSITLEEGNYLTESGTPLLRATIVKEQSVYEASELRWSGLRKPKPWSRRRETWCAGAIILALAGALAWVAATVRRNRFEDRCPQPTGGSFRVRFQGSGNATRAGTATGIHIYLQDDARFDANRTYEAKMEYSRVEFKESFGSWVSPGYFHCDFPPGASPSRLSFAVCGMGEDDRLLLHRVDALTWDGGRWTTSRSWGFGPDEHVWVVPPTARRRYRPDCMRFGGAGGITSWDPSIRDSIRSADIGAVHQGLRPLDGGAASYCRKIDGSCLSGEQSVVDEDLVPK